MKKLLAMILALVMIFALAACGKTAAPAAAPAASEAPAEAEAPAEEAPAEEAPEEIIEETEPVMTHEEFMMADMDSEVVVEGYISAVQQFSEEYGNTSFFMQADDGAYFVYRIPCTAEDYEAFQVGQKIRITGFKTEWAGEVEIADASFQLIGDEKEYAAADVTDLLGDDHLIHAMNLKVSFKGLQVKAANDEGAAFLYNWDGSGEDGNDLYFNVALNGEPYTFTVESDLCPAGSDVYEAVKALNVGDRINLEGFLYWYEGPNPHITAVTPCPNKSEGVMTYAEFVEAPVDTEVTIEAFVQACQAYSEEYGNTSLYLQDEDGGYFVYRLACTADDYMLFYKGREVRVTGYKAEWAGEAEIVDATFEVLDGSYNPPVVDVTELLGTDRLPDYMNQYVAITDAVVKESGDAGAAFLYNWDGSGEDGNDLYFNVEVNGNVYTFTVESDLCGAGTDVYETVKTLNVGDTVDLEGFLYWYEGPNPHITSVTVK